MSYRYFDPVPAAELSDSFDRCLELERESVMRSLDKDSLIDELYDDEFVAIVKACEKTGDYVAIGREVMRRINEWSERVALRAL